MSRTSEVLNELELAAKKLGMSIEEAVSILMGKHPHHVVAPAAASAETEAKVAEGTGSAQSAASAGGADTPQPEAEKEPA